MNSARHFHSRTVPRLESAQESVRPRGLAAGSKSHPRVGSRPQPGQTDAHSAKSGDKLEKVADSIERVSIRLKDVNGLAAASMRCACRDSQRPTGARQISAAE